MNRCRGVRGLPSRRTAKRKIPAIGLTALLGRERRPVGVILGQLRYAARLLRVYGAGWNLHETGGPGEAPAPFAPGRLQRPGCGRGGSAGGRGGLGYGGGFGFAISPLPFTCAARSRAARSVRAGTARGPSRCRGCP